MEHQTSLVSCDARLEDLPFAIPQALLTSVLVSPNFVETLNNAEEFMTKKDFRTSATLFTVVLQRLQAAPQLVAMILCKRAECLLHMNYVQHVLKDCEVAVRMIGGADEHLAFLIFRALELQGEVQKAFGHAVVYEALDPEMKRDKDAVCRLRLKVQWLCVQGDHQVFRTIQILMANGKTLFQNGETKIALNIFSEVLCLFPAVLEAHEYQALCLFNLGDHGKARIVCKRALDLSQRTSLVAFDILVKIEMHWGHLREAMELVKEWRMIDPENEKLDRIQMHIDTTMRGLRNRTGISQSQSMLDLSVTKEAGASCERKQISGTKSQKDFKRPQGSLEETVKSKADDQKKNQQETTYNKDAGAVAAKDIPPDVPPKLPPERSKKKKRRGRRINRRAAKEDDDSDASSVCSICTCPGDIELRRDSLHRPKMPSFEDGDLGQGTIKDQPKTSAKGVPAQEPPKSSSIETSRIRRRPPGVRTRYRLCRYYQRTGKICFQGKLCEYAHSEEERLAWEKARKQDYRNKIAQEWKAKVEKERSSQKQSSKKQSDGIRPRPLEVYGAYRLCTHYVLRGACPSGNSECRFAHSQAERKAWEEERAKAFRKSTSRQKKVKTVKESQSSSFSLKEFRQAFRGQCRAPLRILNKGGTYRMCSEWTKGKCKFGRACLHAHGEKELSAWNEHLKTMKKETKRKEKERKKKREVAEENKEQKETSSLEENAVTSPTNAEFPTPTYKIEDLVSSLPGVNISCQPSDLDVSLQIPLDSGGENSYNWTFRVCYESSATGHLQDVVLLPQYHKRYTLSSVRFCVESPESALKKVPKRPHTEEITDEFHHRLESHLRSVQGICEVEITVTFSTQVFGSFAQVLVLDFGKGSSPLAVKMNIEVGSQEFLQDFHEDKSELALEWTPWDDGSHEIIKFEPKQPTVFNDDPLMEKYKLPKAEDIVPCPLLDQSQGLSPKNYVAVMHQLLFVEEVYIRKQIASFNMQGATLHATNVIVKKDEFACAGEGWLYGSFHVLRPITPDDAQGRLLFRNFGSVLIANSQQDSVVYEALIDSVEDRRVILKLSKQCCKGLELSHNTSVTVDIQFHVNRLPLCEMHDNLDRLGPEHFRILFPELGSAVLEEKVRHLPWILDPNLNEDQKEIIQKIAAPSIDAPPLVVFGPFGTGKTFTLSQAIRRISVNQNNRVLICTHSNSAADLHVRLLDTYLKEQHGMTACKPLRIYTPLRKLSTISDTVKEYCLIADIGTPAEAIKLPTRDDVIRHRVVVCTLSMSRALFDMDLHGKYFSHILIDEAAQALETETLTPLTLAGNNTKVVFTGDHMQMSPDVFSPQAKKWGFQISLQERLFYDYNKRRQDGSKLDPNLVLLAENYRSNARLLQFSSDMFYEGGLSSGRDQPLHPQFGPLVFYAALGKEEIEGNNASYRNLAEVNEIVKRVKEVSDCWPEEWGTRDLRQIGVVSSYRYQVKTIRDGLRKIGLEAVSVETIENVQGKEFRALFVSTVRTFHKCKEPRDQEAGETEGDYWYFLSDPKLLNTALTRAQSLIAVVGNPFSLSTIGDCQELWKEFINRCSEDGQLFGIEHSELEECISPSGFNVNAVEFVPKMTSDACPPPSSNIDLLSSCSLNAPQQVDVTNQKGRNRFSLGETIIEDNETEHNSISDFEDAGDEMSESDNFGNADDFAEYDNVDETVPPKYMDPIIQALTEKCEEQKLKRKLRDEVKCEDNEASEEMIQVPLNNKGIGEGLDFNTAGSKMVHEDIKMMTKGGKTKLLLVNLQYKYSKRTERLLRPPQLRDQERLQPDYVQRLLQDNPKLYRKCTLRVAWDGSRTLCGELQDCEAEDILIEGNPRQTFDQDVVVVELSEKSSTDSQLGPVASERLRGKVRGVLHSVINFRERQFVCTISRDDPRLMLPINKSMSRIAYLTDESCQGVPVYRKIEPDSDEKAVRIRTLPMKEALSGRFFFVVQYLQWRPEFPFPLGIVTKTIRKNNGIPGALSAEYKVKEEFPEEVSREVDSYMKRWSSIPYHERNMRRLVQKAFTIDPPGSKSLDDALTIKNLGNDHWEVGVHITDVSYYVPVGSKIDDEARKRGASYMGGNRYGDAPMLPLPLSHDICSLLPSEERLAVSVFLRLDQDGRLLEERELDFCRSIVKSQVRLTYAQAQHIILDKPIKVRREDGQLTSEIKQSIKWLNSVAQKRRKLRLLDGWHFHFDHEGRKEDFEAHELVEEMMILANSAVGKYLVDRKADMSPLRIQRPPKTRTLNDWREKFGNCAKLSLSLRRHLNGYDDDQLVEEFIVPASTWRLISEARRNRDHRKLNLLICNDKIYPQLVIAHSFLNSVQRKAEDVIAGDVTADDRQHWSLNVREYTRFTSPLRRYLDIVAHRLLFHTAGQEVVADDADKVYRRCSFLSEKSTMFEKDCARAEVAAKLSKQSCEYPAVVEMIEEDFIRIQLVSDANQYLSSKQRQIQVRHLGPIEQPNLDKTSELLELKWKLRIYDASAENIRRAKRSRDQCRHLIEDTMRMKALFPVSGGDLKSGYSIGSRLWLHLLDAVKENDERRLSKCLTDLDEVVAHQKKEMSRLTSEKEKRINSFFVEQLTRRDENGDGVDVEDSDQSDYRQDEDYEDNDDNDDESDFREEEEEEEEKQQQQNEDFDDRVDEQKDRYDTSLAYDSAAHFIETSLSLKVADSVTVQLSANDSAGLMSPEIQLFNLAPGIDICLEHRKLPDKCFSTAASDKASQPRYMSITKYVHVWKPVLDMEAASVAVRNDDTIILKDTEVTWKRDGNGKLYGEFQLHKNFYETRQVDIFHGDYACVKVHCLPQFSSDFINSDQLNGEDELSKKMEEDVVTGRACDVLSGERGDGETSSKREDDIGNPVTRSYWVGHCIFIPADPLLADNSEMKYKLKLFQNSMEVPDELDNRNSWVCTVEIIKQTVPSRRMISTVLELLKMEQPENETLLAHDICLGKALRLPDRHIRLPSDGFSIVEHVNGCNMSRLNNFQVAAVRKALRRRFTLIQGPPGTGKTMTGVHIAYWFKEINHRDTYQGDNPRDTPKEDTPQKAPPQVLYCGPSNKSVDVVAEYFIGIPGMEKKILRVYGNVIEEEEFPIPNQVKQTRKTALYEVPKKLKRVALHHVIRDKERSPFASKLKKCEREFARLKKAKEIVEDGDVEKYLKLIQEAERWVIRSVCKGEYHQVILCTCSTAGSKRVRTSCNNTQQCIVDESGMCLEPETIVPIVWSQAKQVVLIGDHMQLQPIVINRVARSLGLTCSLFERYAINNDALMLEEQYRMHEAICEFPSRQFYGDKLKTANSVKERERNTRVNRKLIEFWPSHEGRDYVPLAFCNVMGKEEELVVATDEGNERSKSNLKEKDKVVEVIKRLIDCGVTENQIVVLTPYRAQCHLIEEDLKNQELSKIQVMSIVKSQGSESDFVIISLVRSLPVSQIDCEPSGGWLREKLGFVTDGHQINVALTRAKSGLCIIGNKSLLEVCELWYNVIDHYRKKSCLVDGADWPVP